MDQRNKTKWRPDEYERVFCPLLRTSNKHRTSKQSLYWVQYIGSCDDIIDNTQLNTGQVLPACLTEHQPHRHSTVSLRTLQFIIFSTEYSCSVSYRPPCYTQNLSLHIHNICLNVFLKSTTPPQWMSQLCRSLIQNFMCIYHSPHNSPQPTD